MPSAVRIALRLVLAAGAVAACAAIVTAARSEDRCAEAGAAVLRDVNGSGRPGALAPALATLGEGCTETRPLVLGATELARGGREAEAAPMARLAVRTEPENPGAWLALFLALRQSDPRGAEMARARVVELNPLAAR